MRTTRRTSLRLVIAIALFDLAVATNTVEAYQVFLRQYPEGEFAAETREVLSSVYPSFKSIDVG